MFCFIISLGTFVCGILYLVLQYEVAVGWVQIILGALCLTLVSIWQISLRRDRKTPKPAAEAAKTGQTE